MKKLYSFLMLTLALALGAANAHAQSIFVNPDEIFARAEYTNNTLSVYYNNYSYADYGNDDSPYLPLFQFYDADGITPMESSAYSWLNVFFTSNYAEVECSISNNPGIERTAYFRVVLCNRHNASNVIAVSNLVTISQERAVCPAPDHFALTEGSITQHGGTFTWNGYTDEYKVYVDYLEKAESGDLYEADFEIAGEYPSLWGVYNLSASGFSWTYEVTDEMLQDPEYAPEYTAHSGYRCMKSDNYEVGTTGSVKLYVPSENLHNPTIISFWALLSAGGNNKGSFWIDGIKVLEISGAEFQTKDWTQYTFELETYRDHTLEWKYTKNDDTRYGEDAFFIDDILMYSYDLINSYNPVYVSGTTVTLNDLNINLSGGYTYRAYVQGLCPDETGPSNYVFFTTAYQCQVPDHLTATNVTGSSADLRWEGYGYDHFDIHCTTEDLTPVDVHRVGRTNSSTLTGLSPHTTYKVWLETTCESSMNKATRGLLPAISDTLVFRTNCGAALPYFEDFENCAATDMENDHYSRLPECWNSYNETDYEYYQGYPTVLLTTVNFFGYPYSGERHLCLKSRYASSVNNTDQYAILPAMDTVAVNTLHLSFYACRGNDSHNNVPLYVGVMSDPSDIGTFEPFDTIEITGVNTSVWGDEYEGYQYHGYNQYTVDFSNYTGQGKYIAFMMEPATSSYEPKTIYIDDINCVSTATPSSSCDITFELTDLYGDSWNGAYISLVDNQTGNTLRTFTNENLDGTSELNQNETNTFIYPVSDGQNLSFVWGADGEFKAECSWVIIGTKGDTISQARGSGYNVGDVIATYLVNCSTTPTPPTPPTCEAPVLTVEEVTATYAHITWTGDAQNTTWQFVTDDYDDSYPNERNENYLLLGGLVPETEYIVRVRAICNGTDTSAWSRTTFTTLRAPAVSDSWSDDFNSQYPNWTLEIYGQNTTNKWMLGTAASNDGSKCLYISNDYSTYAYTNTATSTVYAYKFLYFENDQYNFEYDWKCAGESSNDYFKVCLAPKYAYIYGGYLNNGLSYNTVPNGWIAVGTYHSGENTWQRESVNVEVPAGNYMVVILWHNNDSDGENPPAAIDNFSITRFTQATYTINASVNPENSGTVTGTAGNDVFVSGASYAEGTNIILRATPSDNYHFVNWNDGNTDNPRTITVVRDSSFTAHFAVNSFVISTSANPESGGTVTGSGTYDNGATATLTATATE